MFRALQHRNFRLFFMGQGVSLIGTWMQQMALMWLVYRMTSSPMLLGIVAFGSQIPALFISPLAGVFSDRWDRHRAIIITQALAMFQATVLALLAISGRIEVWHIIAISFALGLVNAFDLPMRQAFMYHLVDDKADVPNAIALNSSLVNITRLIGPALAGLVIKYWGETACFVINAATYIAVIAGLWLMTLPPRVAARETRSVLHNLMEGFRYAFGFPPIRDMLFLLAIGSATAMMFTTLLAVFARDVLHGDESTYSHQLIAGGCGALLAALYLARRKTVVGLGRLIPVAAAILGVSVIMYGLTTSTTWSLWWRFTGSFGIMFQMAASNTIIQTIVEDGKRGRVMAFYSMAMMGSAPIGSLIGGFLSGAIGPGNTLIVTGILCTACAGLFVLRLPVLRAQIVPVYEQLGIMPAAAGALTTESTEDTERTRRRD